MVIEEMLFDLSTMSYILVGRTGLRSGDRDASLAPPLITWVTTGKFLNHVGPHL